MSRVEILFVSVFFPRERVSRRRARVNMAYGTYLPVPAGTHSVLASL